MAAAFAAAITLAATAVAHFGANRTGIDTALQLTARLAFIAFWPSYVGGSLVTLFGQALLPIKRRARELGLAFATILTVHLSLVAWLCWIGAAPSAKTFLIFGIGAAWTALLALASIKQIGQAIGSIGWWILSNIGMSYILYAFALDFFSLQPHASLSRLAQYVPFAAFAVLAAAIRVLAWLKIAMTAAPRTAQT
jgi:hypothetical protein